MRNQRKSIWIGALFFAPLLGLAQTPQSVQRKPAFGHQNTPQPAQTPKYVFYLASFQVMDTRSYHEDTVVAGIGLTINGTPQKTLTHQFGNFNNGKFDIEQKGWFNDVMQVSIGPNDKFVFMFQLFNNGAHHHPNSDELEAYIDRDLLNSGKYIDGTNANPTWSEIIPIARKGAPGGDALLTFEENAMTGGMFSAVKGLFEGCDGPLAFGVIAGTGAELNLRVPVHGPLPVEGDFKGTWLKLGAPCNHAGSHYIVNVVIARR